MNPETLSQQSNSCVTETTPVRIHLWKNVFILVGKFLTVCAAIVLKNERSYLQKTTLLSGLSEKFKGRKEAVRSFFFACAMRDFAGFIPLWLTFSSQSHSNLESWFYHPAFTHLHRNFLF